MATKGIICISERLLLRLHTGYIILYHSIVPSYGCRDFVLWERNIIPNENNASITIKKFALSEENFQ